MVVSTAGEVPQKIINRQGEVPPPGVDLKVWQLMTEEERQSVRDFAEFVKSRRENSP